MSDGTPPIEQLVQHAKDRCGDRLTEYHARWCSQSEAREPQALSGARDRALLCRKCVPPWARHSADSPAPGAVTGVHLLKRQNFASVVPAPSALSVDAVAAAGLWTPLPGPCAPRGTPLPARTHVSPNSPLGRFTHSRTWTRKSKRNGHTRKMALAPLWRS